MESVSIAKMSDVNPEARHLSSYGSRQEFWFTERAEVKTRQTVSDIKQIRSGAGKRESRVQRAGQRRDQAVESNTG